MGWLDRARRRPLRQARADEPEESIEAPVERSAPGVAKLFSTLSEDGRHSVLDLGHAADRHLRLFSRFARHVRFAGLVPEPPRGWPWSSGREALAPNPHRPYDVVLAWDVLDRLDASQRAALIERLADLTAPGARLYVVVRTSDGATTRPVRSTLIDLDRVTQCAVGRPEPARDPLLPAHVERLLAPFEVAHAFILRTGWREYVAVKR